MASKKLRFLAIGVILVVFIVVLLLYVKGETSGLLNIGPAPTSQGSLSLSANLGSRGVVGYNNAQSVVYYSIVNYAFDNGSQGDFSLNVYRYNPIERVYLVNVSNYCVSCFNGISLYNELKFYLERYGLVLNQSSLNYVTLQNLPNIPNDSIVIIPSGLMPISLLPDTQSSFTIFDMFRRGDTVIYAGQNFSRAVGPQGTILIPDFQTIAALDNASLGTSSTNIPIARRNTLYFDSPLFTFPKGIVYNDVFAMNYTTGPYSRGAMVVFSNYPEVGWKNTSEFASDIANVINSRFWTPVLSAGAVNITIPRNRSGSVTLFTVNKTMPDVSNVSNIVSNSYALVSIQLFNSTSFQAEQVPFMVHYNQNGTLGIPNIIGETQQVPIYISFSNSTRGLTELHINLYNAELGYATAITLGSLNTSLGIVKYQSFSIPPGYYIAFVKDFDNRTYSSSLFYVANATITATNLNFKNGTFSFRVTSNRIAVSNTSYTVNINNIYSQSGVVTDGTLYYTLPPGTVINYGSQKFNFNIFGGNYTYTYPYTKVVFNIPVLYIEFGIVGVVIILLNLFLRPPARDEYYIDVPDFPPTKKATLKVDTNSVLNIFDTVNYYYHWRYMPLLADEIKSGIGNNIRQNNMPISITLQNTEKILDRLVSSGVVVASSDYYAPKRWLDVSKHDMEYLVIFRKLRDYAVTHAMLFTDLDSAVDSDMLITKGGMQNHIIIFSSQSNMRSIKISNEYRIFIVFINSGERLDFMNRVYQSYGEEAELMKIGIEYGYIKLIDTDNLDQLVI